MQLSDIAWIPQGDPLMNPSNITELQMWMWTHHEILLRAAWANICYKLSSKNCINNFGETTAEEVYERTAKWDASGRYVVRLPFKEQQSLEKSYAISNKGHTSDSLS